MYIPKYFKVTNVDEIWDFVQKNSFGTIVTTEQGKPIATHLPLGLHKKGDDYYLTGHMAYGNPQWRTFESCEDVLVMFQGAHAIFLLPGIRTKMFRLGIIRRSICMEKQAF